MSHSISKLGYILFCFSSILLFSCEKKNLDGQASMPKTRVACVEISLSDLVPKLELSATVEFSEISELSCETAGLIERADFEEGQTFSKGAELIRLNSDLLEKSIAAAAAELAVANHEMELQKWEFDRIDALLKSGDISEQKHKERTASYQKALMNSERLKAILESKKEELAKKTVRAPYNCAIIKKYAYRGEWAEPGKSLAIVGNSDYIFVSAQAPENLIKFIDNDSELDFQIGAQMLSGKVFSFVKSGDRVTRTFPVKIRLKNDYGFKSGMEGRVWLPAGDKRSSYLILREAIVFRGGSPFIYAAVNGRAEQFAVQIINYEGPNAEITSEKLTDGMKIIVKGNQYLQPGELIEVVQSARDEEK